MIGFSPHKKLQTFLGITVLQPGPSKAPSIPKKSHKNYGGYPSQQRTSLIDLCNNICAELFPISCPIQDTQKQIKLPKNKFQRKINENIFIEGTIMKSNIYSLLVQCPMVFIEVNYLRLFFQL